MDPLRVAISDAWAIPDPERLPWMKALRRRFDVRLVGMDDGADVLFHADFGHDHWRFKGLKVYFSGENMLPDPWQHDFALTSLHRPGDGRHFRIPEFLYAIPGPEALLRPDGYDAVGELASKTGFCSFVVSNPRGSERNRLFRMLHRRRGVASGGRHFNNVGGPVRDKHAFTAAHRFSLCFENTVGAGYTTEKLTDAFLARSVPIYWGNPDVAIDFNPRAMICAHDFPTLEDVAEHVLRVEADESLLLSYLREPPLPGNRVSPALRLEGLDDALSAFLRSGTPPGERRYRRRRLREHCYRSPASQTLHALRSRAESLAWKFGQALRRVARATGSRP
jgi:hypothetical protein